MHIQYIFQYLYSYLYIVRISGPYNNHLSAYSTCSNNPPWYWRWLGYLQYNMYLSIVHCTILHVLHNQASQVRGKVTLVCMLHCTYLAVYTSYLPIYSTVADYLPMCFGYLFMKAGYIYCIYRCTLAIFSCIQVIYPCFLVGYPYTLVIYYTVIRIAKEFHSL